MAKPTQINKITREILQKFPNSSKRALAELLLENYPTLFTSFDHARSIIRKVTSNNTGHAKLSPQKLKGQV